MRERQGLSYGQERARQIAEEAIRSAALVRNEMAARIRREVDEDIFHAVRSRMTLEDRARLMGLLDATELRDYETGKRTALLACLVQTARRRARDDLAEMFCGGWRPS